MSGEPASPRAADPAVPAATASATTTPSADSESTATTPAARNAVLVQSEDPGPPVNVIENDEDLLDDFPEDAEDLDLVHLRVESIPALHLERFPKLQVGLAAVRTHAHRLSSRARAHPRRNCVSGRTASRRSRASRR